MSYDNTNSRPLLCPGCDNVLGYVVRGTDHGRARRLNVLRIPRRNGEAVPDFNLYNYSVLNLDQGDVPCVRCGTIFEWKSSDFIKRKEVLSKPHK